MNIRTILSAVPLAVLAACGSDSSPTYTLASGQYDVSAGTATATFAADNCNVVQFFTTGNPPIDIAVTGTNVKFDLKGGQTADQFFAKGAISGNAITNVTDASYTQNSGACLYRVTVKVRGDLTANDNAHLIATYTKAAEPGSTCTATDLGAKTATSCSSEVDFLAKKR